MQCDLCTDKEWKDSKFMGEYLYSDLTYKGNRDKGLTGKLCRYDPYHRLIKNNYYMSNTHTHIYMYIHTHNTIYTQQN